MLIFADVLLHTFIKFNGLVSNPTWTSCESVTIRRKWGQGKKKNLHFMQLLLLSPPGVDS